LKKYILIFIVIIIQTSCVYSNQTETKEHGKEAQINMESITDYDGNVYSTEPLAETIDIFHK